MIGRIAAWLIIVVILIFAIDGITKVGIKKVDTYPMHDKDPVPCRSIYVNNRGQTICIVYLPDSIYRK